MQTFKGAGMRLAIALIFLFFILGPVTAGTFTANNSSERALVEYKILAAQFLNMATFGPTSADIDALASRMQRIGVDDAREEWIDRQFALPISGHLSLAQQLIRESGRSSTFKTENRARIHSWWQNALAAPDQLRQRVAWALAQIWVVGGAPNALFIGTADYYDVLLQNSFGNYRDLMEDVTLHPVMGVYLDHFRNRKPDPALNRFPDENYAREFLQLFTIGPFELNRNGEWKISADGEFVPSYDNADIESFARVFTGFGSGTANDFWQPPDELTPMRMFESEHDKDRKELLQGRVLPAGQGGMRDVKDAMDNVFEHPNVGPFIARLLIQRLVMSNPPRWYVNRVARAFNGDDGGARGDMRRVIKAILLDPEASRGLSITRPSALSITATSGVSHRSRLQEPVVRYASLVRAFNPSSNCPRGRLILDGAVGAFDQGPYASPSVFNFYLPDFRPGGKLQEYTHPSLRDGVLVAPEFQLLTSSGANRFSNRIYGDVRSEAISVNTIAGQRCRVQLDLTREKQLALSNPAELMRHLDLLLCQGTMSDSSRRVIEEEIVSATNLRWLSQNQKAQLRATSAVIATTLSPDCAISP
ncbi:DUF1800 domain-containing protein [Thiocapsa marina]|uniref:DUF1800 domain-containing protein n=1 Tax=Thiocapsa marina 5811 TaxID=768671 RepID=F9UI49_9GAMM|nr:DUF1800 family protein [Thiocapsa marina]EGV16108.1 protein of unknown function DUF1800 [Thiocapsa marina 5811]